MQYKHEISFVRGVLTELTDAICTEELKKFDVPAFLMEHDCQPIIEISYHRIPNNLNFGYVYKHCVIAWFVVTPEQATFLSLRWGIEVCQ